MNLKLALGELSRKELKVIMAGSGSNGNSGYMCCNTHGCSQCVTPASPACVAGAWPVPC
ncbi:hypothetical protein [Chryseobacterium hagamense]|uniref:hypothetical protein n=1 Tax=Chryseobacterium hagamense TaxID=395935 RepID=UPI0014792859|nr:hypothetical protein [Chryseobacterium hagamense]